MAPNPLGSLRNGQHRAADSLGLTRGSVAVAVLRRRRRRRRPEWPGRRPRPTLASGLGDSIKRFWESLAYENWAPRSARTWKLGRVPPTPDRDGLDKELLWRNLEDEMIKSLEDCSRPPSAPLGDDEDGDDPYALDDDSRDGERAGDDDNARIAGSWDHPSIVESTDGAIAAALDRRIDELSIGSRGPEGGDEEASGADAAERGLTGVELRELIRQKYGNTYDVALARGDIGGRTLVSLNVMWAHLEQRSFPMSEAEYDEKLEALATFMNAWGQAGVVRRALKEPPRSKAGRPSRPVVGLAQSIHLELDPAVIDEWFTRP